MKEIIDVGSEFGKFLSEKYSKNEFTRQQMKMKELGVLTSVCLDKQHGKNTRDFYKCMAVQSQKNIPA